MYAVLSTYFDPSAGAASGSDVRGGKARGISISGRIIHYFMHYRNTATIYHV